MLCIWAMLLHSKAVTAAEKYSGLLDNQPSLQFPEISIVPLAPVNYACLHPSCENIWNLFIYWFRASWNMLAPTIISEVNRSLRAISCASSLAFDTALMRFAAL